ncbi:hypothetical protein [Streptomyces sp. NPDC029674]|uniref:hypothetical protein n=1 Tax=Streptomyces sp. NPDC029674 TaxID=3365297 RepID=UPI00384FF312
MAERRQRRRFVPPPALCGFLVLMVLVFAASYAVGRAVGPGTPGDKGGGGGGAGGTHSHSGGH